MTLEVHVREQRDAAGVVQRRRFEVQVGAFEESDQAHQVLETVRERFSEAYIAPRDGPEGKYYRVADNVLQPKPLSRPRPVGECHLRAKPVWLFQ